MTETTTAFVLGGGGVLGAAEVGMLQALHERGIQPDLIVGTSIGAINGAMIAADPSAATISVLAELWKGIKDEGPFHPSWMDRISATIKSGGTHVYPVEPLRRLLSSALPVETFEECQVPFYCCAASIERSAERWFDSGSLIPAILASAALPGVFPPMVIDGEHYIDGGIVNSIPLDRARKLGATVAYVLQVGRIEQPLTAPSTPWHVAQIAFEVARRARFHAALQRTREMIDVYVLPTGGAAPQPTSWKNFDFRDTHHVAERIDEAYEATRTYLDAVDAGTIDPRSSIGDDPTVATPSDRS